MYDRLQKTVHLRNKTGDTLLHVLKNNLLPEQNARRIGESSEQD